ncbi:MAG: hypothetical protein RL341_970 [Pseudomonadota bacterium]|jgi:hypothetical protein
MKAQRAICLPVVAATALGLFGTPASAGPLDGPVLEAQTIVISGNIRGEITNGKQATSWQACVIFCVSGGSSTKYGQLNVNGIVQHGGSVLRANTIVLQNDLTHNLNNKEGTQNYKGIMQIGR